ncbi:MAG: hypothetical protein ACP6IY_16410 [Promethearchaeia archaeon]
MRGLLRRDIKPDTWQHSWNLRPGNFRYEHFAVHPAWDFRHAQVAHYNVGIPNIKIIRFIQMKFRNLYKYLKSKKRKFEKILNFNSL